MKDGMNLSRVELSRREVLLAGQYEACRQRVNEAFWHEGQGIYLNRYRDGRWRHVKSLTCFCPLLVDAPTPSMAAGTP
jgi:hypothetical protein